MARRLLLAATGAIALVAAGLGTATAQAASPSPATPKITTVHSCAKPAKGYAACFAVARTDSAAMAANARMNTALAVARAAGRSAAAATPAGYAPSDLRDAYKLTATGSSSQTIAIVDAYDDPTAEADLGVYRAQYGLGACTTASGCFKKVNQNGVQGNYPRKDAGWATEISLDLDMASAICPACKILLVEASTPSFANLGAAENTAAKSATVISNSYGGSDASDSTYGLYYNHPGVAITVSSGDSGYGVEYPASSQFVTAVGGTHLVRGGNTGRGWTETAWSGAGSGCSTINPKLDWQSGLIGTCTKRAVADVSAVADPATGVAVYDSTPYQGRSGWLVFGGTSVSAPIIASVYALAGNAASVTYGSYPYKHTSGLFDVVGGSNGSCGGTLLCNAVTGWDGPTGLGTPNGAGAF